MSDPIQDEQDREGEERRDDRSSRKKKKKKDRRRSRSRSRSRRHRSGSRSTKRKEGRSRSRDKEDKDRRRRKRSNTAEREERRRKEMEREQDRDSYTVFVSQIHPKVDERDLFEFFSHVGQVEDIRLIRDQRTHKSKGLAYIEFWEKDCVNKAIALTGQSLGGYPITIQITPSAEKAQDEVRPMKLYIGSLHPNVTERDLRPVFEAFGTVEDIDVQRDAGTNKSKGFGFVTYKNEADARQALANLDGLEIAGKAMKVTMAQDEIKGGGGDLGMGELDDMGGGGFNMTAQSRMELMQKLQRGQQILPAIKMPGLPGMGQHEVATTPIAMQPSACVIIKNMFDPKEETDADFHLDIEEDVKEEVSKYGPVTHAHADKNSDGHVYIKFQAVSGAQGCISALNGRWFASRQISAQFMPEATYRMKFPRA